MTNLEAMAASTAVVATTLPAVREYAVDGENCRLVSPGDVDALSNALAELLSSPDDRERLASAGRETAETFSWENQAQELLTYCREACE
jgi:glycosyltransferase involved in cell wall biosynthesis